MARRLMFIALGLVLAAGCSGPKIEVQTFDLEGMDPAEAQELIRPYVFEQREPIPGMVSIAGSRLTVRETRDHLSEIAKVLAQYDRAKPHFGLVVRVIEADGYAADPALEDIGGQLEQVFRFKGYRMAGRVVTEVAEHALLHNMIGATLPAYRFDAEVRQIVSGDDGWRIRMRVVLGMPGVDLIETEAVLRPGQTTLVGTSRLNTPAGTRSDRGGEASSAVILALRLEPRS